VSIREIRDPDEFQRLSQLLLCAEYPDTRIVNDSSGDGGMDAYVPSTQTLYAMYCPEVVPRPKARYQEKIGSDLKKAVRLRDQLGYDIRRWIFLTPAPLEEELHRYIEEKARQAGFATGVNQSEPHLLELLLRNPEVRPQFPKLVFPDLEAKLDVRFSRIEQRIDEVNRELLRSVHAPTHIHACETGANYSMIVDDASDNTGEASFPLPENLIPSAIPDFVGRENLLEEMAEVAKQGGMVVITGITGSGKTALLGQLAARKDAPTRFGYKCYPGLHSFADLLTRLSRFLFGGKHTPINRDYTLQKWSEEIIEALNRGEYWLFFDGADHLAIEPAFAGFFALLKDRLHSGAVFLASCTKPDFLTPVDEATQRVRVIQLEDLRAEEVRDLLRAKGIFIGEEAAEKITDDLGGLPMALELLSALAGPGCTERDLLNHAEKAREQTLDYLSDQVFSVLQADERELLTIAALFSLPFNREHLIEAYRRITGRNGHQAFANLRRRALIGNFADELYELQELVGTLAINRAEGELKDRRYKTAACLVEIEPEEILPQLNALQMYRQSQAFDEAAEVAVSLIDSGLMPYSPLMARDIIDSFSQEQVSPERWLWLVGERGIIASFLREYERAEACYREMLRLAQAEGNKPAQAIAYQRLGILAYDSDDQTGEQFYLRSLALKEELNDLQGQAEIYNNLGLLYEHRGEPDRAQAMLEKGLTIHSQLNSPEWQCLSIHSNLGILAARQERWAQAYHYSETALRIARECGSPYEIARATFNLGRHDLASGKIEAARERFNRILAIVAEYELKDLEELVYSALARLCHDLGDNDQTIVYLHRVARIQELFDDRRKLAVTYCDLGASYLRNGDSTQGFHYYCKGIALFAHTTDNNGIDTFLANIISFCHDTEEAGMAQRLRIVLKHQRRRLQGTGLSYPLARICGALGRIRLLNRYYDKLTFGYLAREIDLLKALGRKQDQLDALMNMGYACQKHGSLTKAIRINQQAVELAASIGSRESLAGLTYNLANCYMEAEDFESAEYQYQQALPVAVEVGNRSLRQMIEHNLGEALRRAGKLAEAICQLNESHTLARELDDTEGQALALNNIGLAYEESGCLDEAKSHFDKALALCRQHKLRREESNTLINMGNFYYRDEPVIARCYYEQSLAVARIAEDSEMEEKAMLSLVFICRKLGVVEEIQYDFQAVAERAQRLGHYGSFVKFLIVAGEINLSEGDLESAAEMFEKALLFALLIAVQRSDQAEDDTSEIVEVVTRLVASLIDLSNKGQQETAGKFYRILMGLLMKSPQLGEGNPLVRQLSLLGEYFDKATGMSLSEFVMNCFVVNAQTN